MGLGSLINKIGGGHGIFGGKKVENTEPPVLEEPFRVPYGAFQCKAKFTSPCDYVFQASSDLKTWIEVSKGKAKQEVIEQVDSEAHKLNARFYRILAGSTQSANVLGYATVSLPPGFSMIANPFASPNTVGDTFQGWPDGTALHRFDTRLFRLAENGVKNGKWTNPAEKLVPGEGAIFFNSTSDYKTASFVGEVLVGNLSAPVPSGFSIRSSMVPQPGNLVEDLKFPITDGDVIHLFDRERQKYVLHPYEKGQWKAGPPIIGIGESFWVAKTVSGNWTRSFFIGD
jgi:hypothetical protein